MRNENKPLNFPLALICAPAALRARVDIEASARRQKDQTHSQKASSPSEGNERRRDENEKCTARRAKRRNEFHLQKEFAVKWSQWHDKGTKAQSERMKCDVMNGPAPRHSAERKRYHGFCGVAEARNNFNAPSKPSETHTHTNTHRRAVMSETRAATRETTQTLAEE